MKYRIIIIFIVFILLPFKVSANCLRSGYAILTVNGIFTDENKAWNNAYALRNLFSSTYNNEPLYVDYLYNGTHILGVKDIFDAIEQKLFENQNISDYDMQEMISDASQKIKTEKFLLVAHSQGNFYSNAFYNIVTEKNNVSKESIGIYGVASPASYVSGGGKYITSSTDKVINAVRMKGILNVLKPNVDIKVEDPSSNGHGFSDVYLRYEGNRIINEIKTSLDKLKVNQNILVRENCIDPPQVSVGHKIEGLVLNSADVVLNTTKEATISLGSSIKNIILAIGNKVNGLMANAIDSIDGAENLTTLSPDILKNLEPVQENSTQNTLNIAITEQAENNNQIKENNDTTTTEILTEDTQENKELENKDKKEIENNKKDEIQEGEKNETKETEAVPLWTLLGTGGSTVSTETEEENQEKDNDTDNSDTKAPEITLTGNEFELIPVNSVFTDSGATAFDEKDGVVLVSTSGSVDTSKIGLYEITYSASDSSGNTTSKSRKVKVDDGTKMESPNMVVVYNNYAYVVSEKSNSFEIIDISDLNNLKHQSSLIHDHARIELFAPKAVAVNGNYAYVVSYSNNLNVIDISNPIIPEIKSTLNYNVGEANLFGPVSIVISGNYVYVASYLGNALEIIDISNPLQPTHKSFIDINSPISLTISGNYAYLTSFAENSFKIVDIGDPSNPILKSTLYNRSDGTPMDSPQSTAISGNYAYVVSRGDNTLNVINISDPSHPIYFNKISAGENNVNFIAPTSITIYQNYAYILSYVGSDLEVIDITDPTLLKHIYTMKNNVGGANIYYPKNIAISNSHAFITSSLGNALEVVDISNPEMPTHKNKILNSEFSHTDPVLKTEKKITSFIFDDLDPDVIGNIDEENHTITLHVPTGTDLTNLSPNIILSTDASVTPLSKTGQNFTNPIYYTVTAQNGNYVEYKVSVEIDSTTDNDNTDEPLSIESYKFNENSGDITINPTTTPVLIQIKANENVNWLSLKIENDSDTTKYKLFQSGTGCVDGTDTCEKNWDGTLTRGGILTDGTYKIKVHIKDPDDNEFYDYLTPYNIIVTGQTI